MGLDVYLYHKLPDYDEWDAKEDKFNKASDEFYKDEYQKAGYVPNARYEDVPKEVHDRAHQRSMELAKSLGLSEWGSVPDGHKETCIETPSKTNPKHLFKIGYFRSSYNDDGIEHVVGDLTGKDLYWIFAPGDEYHVQPDWKAALARAVEARDTLAMAIEKEPWRVLEFRNWSFKKADVHSKEDAINMYRAEKAEREENRKKYQRPPSDMDNWGYSGQRGDFWPKGYDVKILGVIMGDGWGASSTCYMIIEDRSGLGWYLQALDIVVETIEHVLAQPDPEAYYLHWSG